MFEAALRSMQHQAEEGLVAVNDRGEGHLVF
jgi:hypothetical protein